MIADILVVLFVAIFIWVGYKSGLMRSLIKIASYIISIIVAFLVFPVVSDFLMSTKLYSWIEQKVSESGLPAIEPSGFFAKYLSEGAESINNGISSAVAQLLINIAAFILVLVISRILMLVICKVLDVFTHLPVINQFNRLGGAVLGGVLGIVALYIVFAAVVLLAPFEENGKVIAELEKSSFAGEMYENNMLINLIEGEQDGKN